MRLILKLLSLIWGVIYGFYTSVLAKFGKHKFKVVEKTDRKKQPQPISLLGRNNAPPEMTEWRLFRTISDYLFMPRCTLELLAVFAHGPPRFEISLEVYLQFLLHMSMIECGFLPIMYKTMLDRTTGKRHLFRASVMMLTDFLVLTMSERMEVAMIALKKWYQSVGSIRLVEYEYLLVPHDVFDLDGYSFGPQTITAGMTCHRGIGVKDGQPLVMARVDDTKTNVGFPVLLNNYLIKKKFDGSDYDLDDGISIYHLLDIVNHDRFMFDIKANLCRPMIDNNDAMECNREGFRCLPTNVLLHIASFLDFKSFAKLSQVCASVHYFLDQDAAWKNVCLRIPMDFANNNWNVHDSLLRAFQYGPQKELFMRCFALRHRELRPSRLPVPDRSTHELIQKQLQDIEIQLQQLQDEEQQQLQDEEQQQLQDEEQQQLQDEEQQQLQDEEQQQLQDQEPQQEQLQEQLLP